MQYLLCFFSQEKQYQCDVCGKKYAHKKDLQVHTQAAHTDTAFRCDVCPKIFNSERNLSRHKAANHKDITYTCEICKNTYLYKSTLARHIRKCNQIVWTFLWTLWDIHFDYLRFIIDIALILHFFSYYKNLFCIIKFAIDIAFLFVLWIHYWYCISFCSIRVIIDVVFLCVLYD